jgi:putative photosynthetic complex assembly protein
MQQKRKIGTGKLQPYIPKSVVIFFAGLIAASVIFVTIARLNGSGQGIQASAPIALTRTLLFEDRKDGSVGIWEPNKRDAMTILPGGTNGFIRATMRGLARERKRMGEDMSKPFQLSSHTDGTLTLNDTATGRMIDLGSFGVTNAQDFARLLPQQVQPVAVPLQKQSQLQAESGGKQP